MVFVKEEVECSHDYGTSKTKDWRKKIKFEENKIMLPVVCDECKRKGWEVYDNFWYEWREN